MTAVSCDEWQCRWDTPSSDWFDRPYWYDVCGCWESCYGYDGYSEYDIWGLDVVGFEFDTDLTGCYYYFSGMGYTYIDFKWEMYGDRILIWYIDGFYEEVYFNYDDYGFLVLSSSKYFHDYTAYRPTGFRYEQSKAIDPAKAKKFDAATDKQPRSAAMKAKE